MQELTINSVALVVAKKKKTEAEETLVKRLDKAETVGMIVPQDINAEDFRVCLGAVCKTWSKSLMASEMLYPVLGQLMMVATDNPELWNQKFQTFEEFSASVSAEYGVSRSTLQESRKHITRWGTIILMADFQSIGRVRLKEINGVVPKGEEKEKKCKKLLEVAATGSRQEFDDYIEKNYLSSSGDRVPAVFKIPCSKKQAAQFKKWFERPEVVAYVGSDKWSTIMESAMAELEQDWIVKGEAAIEKAQGATEAA